MAREWWYERRARPVQYRTHAPHRWNGAEFLTPSKWLYRCKNCETEMHPGVPCMYRRAPNEELQRDRPPCPIHTVAASSEREELRK